MLVKGFLFTKHPHMIIKGFKDPLKILEQLDTLCEKSNVEQNSKDKKNKYQIKEYFSKDLLIKIFITNDKDNYSSIYKMYSIIEQAAPDLITAFKYTSETIIVAIPRVDSFEENASYSLLMDELTRLTTYMLMEYDNDEDRVVEAIQSFLSMFVSTPMTRMITDFRDKSENDDDNDQT